MKYTWELFDRTYNKWVEYAAPKDLEQTKRLIIRASKGSCHDIPYRIKDSHKKIIFHMHEGKVLKDLTAPQVEEKLHGDKPKGVQPSGKVKVGDRFKQNHTDIIFEVVGLDEETTKFAAIKNDVAWTIENVVSKFRTYMWESALLNKSFYTPFTAPTYSIQLPNLEVKDPEYVTLNRRGRDVKGLLISKDKTGNNALLYVIPEAGHVNQGAYYHYSFQVARIDGAYSDGKHYLESPNSFIDLPGEY